MTIRHTLTAIATGTALLLTAPVHAGGPVIIEDTTESAPVVRDKRDNTALLIFGAIVVGALLLGGGGSDVCNGDDQPTPEPGPCQ